MEPRIRYVTSSDGVSIAFWTLGEGKKPLVCLAGGPWCHVESWYLPECHRWYERLAQERMLVWHDLRGTGFSEREVSDYSLEALVADVEAVVDRLGLDDFGVLASVDAGPVAVAYAARHPERVSDGQIVLEGTFGRATLCGTETPSARASTAALTTLGRADLHTDHDLSAQALSTQ